MLALAQRKAQFNALEPASLTKAFLRYPPEGFNAFQVPMGDGVVQAFHSKFDLLTTLDDDQRWIIDALKKYNLSQVTVLPTVFSGTTVTEYMTFPIGVSAATSKELLNELVNEVRGRRAQLLIVKDLPVNSPLLSQEENEASEKFRSACGADGRFILVEGQALAYVPIDFATIDQYLAKQSKLRRKDLRKKLRAKATLTISEIPTGTAFEDAELLNEVYSQYLNVYEQSKYHFDKLSFGFFREILTDGTNGGVVFMYRKNGKLIGYNICFVHEGNLVDKYVGFAYPEARESNLYFVSWFQNLEYAMKNGLRFYIAGWTDPEVKAFLGASFTFTQHAVYIRNSLLRAVLYRFKSFFESDSKVVGERS